MSQGSLKMTLSSSGLVTATKNAVLGTLLSKNRQLIIEEAPVFMSYQEAGHTSAVWMHSPSQCVLLSTVPSKRRMIASPSPGQVRVR